MGRHAAALKVRLGASPVDGKANDALIAYLADRLDLPKSRVIGVAAEAVKAEPK